MNSRIKCVLVRAGVQYRERSHSEMSIPITSPQDVAAALEFEIGRIAKTLLLCTPGEDQFCLAVLSCNKRIDMKLVAATLGVKRLQVASKAMLTARLGYPPTGVSPVGCAESHVLMDELLMRFDTVLVGGGEVGVEIELSPADLQVITNAKVARLSS